MMTRQPLWLSQMARAARADLAHWLTQGLTSSNVWGFYSARWARIPYGWQPGQAIVEASRAEAWQRGACGDAAADAAAAAFAAGLRASVCIQAPPHMEGYAHARLLVESVHGVEVIDPYADERPDGVGEACEYVISASDLLTSSSPMLRQVGEHVR